MNNLIKDCGSLIYGQGLADLGVWTRWLLDFCDLNERRLNLIWLPARKSAFSSTDGLLILKLGDERLKNDKNKSLGLMFHANAL